MISETSLRPADTRRRQSRGRASVMAKSLKSWRVRPLLPAFEPCEAWRGDCDPITTHDSPHARVDPNLDRYEAVLAFGLLMVVVLALGLAGQTERVNALHS